MFVEPGVIDQLESMTAPADELIAHAALRCVALAGDGDFSHRLRLVRRHSRLRALRLILIRGKPCRLSLSRPLGALKSSNRLRRIGMGACPGGGVGGLVSFIVPRRSRRQ